jgi:hypothetical protein
MIKKLTSSNYKNKIGLATSAFLIMNMVVIMSDCGSSPTDVTDDFITSTTSGIDYTISTPPADVPSQSEDASITELAEFAWQEFIALNWPAVSNGRGAPDVSQTNGFITASKVGSATYTPVWQTYWHRNELFPGPDKTPVTPSITDTALPKYQYRETYPYGGSGSPNYTLWNNLDEVNELGEDVVFAHSSTSSVDSTYQVLYEAKMNFEGSNYIFSNNLNDKTTREQLEANTVTNPDSNGVCIVNPDFICLPCGKLKNGNQSAQEGNIEIKAAWRKLTTDEASSNKYHTQEVIYYVNQAEPGSNNVNQVYNHTTMGLVGLHIIHKTETFPDFVYATWEHIDNLNKDSNGKQLVYTEIQNTVFGDVANTINNIERTHPIPATVTSVNSTVAQYLSSQNSVWQYYKLINVQAKPMDVSSIAVADSSSFYLSNSVIESNIELQTFSGSLTNPSAMNIIYKGKEMNMGGCMGCHGNAQIAGADFNFLIAKAPFENAEFTGAPEPGCPPGGEASAIANYDDVKEFFSECALNLNIPSPSAGHGEWWDSCPTDPESYCLFTTGKIYGTKICTPGDSTNSNIVQILRGTSSTGLHMPQGGPYFTADQVTELAKWIQAGCPYDNTNSVTPTNCTNCPPNNPVNN